MRNSLFAAIALPAMIVATPALAEAHMIAPGEGAQERLQEALILAEPGDEIVLEAGRYMLTDGLSLDVDNVTVRGAGMEATVLDFSGQQGAGEGLLVTSDFVTLRDFAVENPKGDGIKSKGADAIIYHKIRVTWTRGPDENNGAYGIYPVESTGVLVDASEVSGASDAGIYVGQSSKITVRNSVATDNVAGIEIENSRDAIVEGNFVSRNTGGILVFDLPNLPVMGGGNVLIRGNLVVANDTDNFAPAGNIVASVRRGTGVMVMANENVWLQGNVISGNETAQVMVIAYPLSFEDPDYNPYPRDVVVATNAIGVGGTRPDIEGGEMLVAAFGGNLPAILWDGLNGDEDRPALLLHPDHSGWSLNLSRQGQRIEEAQPGPLDVPVYGQGWSIEGWGAPEELEARLK